MANRWFRQFRMSLEPAVSDVFARITFGATGAPTIVTAQSKGIVSITRSSAGKYVIVFGTNASMLDTYYKLLGFNYVFDESSNSGTAPVAPFCYVFANAISTVNTASITVVFTNSTGTATDPASTEAVLLNFVFKNSNAP